MTSYAPYATIPAPDSLQFYQAAQYGQQQQQQQQMMQQPMGQMSGGSGMNMPMGSHPYGMATPGPMGHQQQQQQGAMIHVNWRAAFLGGALDGEPPLLQELGINFGHIWDKAFAALNPFRPIQKNLMDDTDLAGPLLFCLMFGIFLLMSKKLVFSYIYGLGALGCLGMYAILNLMSDRGIEGSQTVAVLGYCLLPMVLLSMVTAVLNVSTSFGLLLSGLSVCWCTYSASTMFVTVLSMSDQRLLVAYPVGLLYAIFALLTIF